MGKTNRVMLTAPDEKKHPHVRGEDGMTVEAAPESGEAPPRAKTTNRRVRGLLSRKLPHVRGEDSLSIFAYQLHGETPPRAWGRQTARKLR